MDHWNKAGIGFIAGLLAFGCGPKKADEPIPPVIGEALPRAHSTGSRPPIVRFTDITAAAGIGFRHTNGAFGQRLLPETLGSGVAFLDFDNDGRQDILLVNSCAWPGWEKRDRPAPTLALYRNNGDGTFDDVTQQVGLDITMYGMGITVGDYDNDGWPDLFITGVGGNRLFHNVSGGTAGRRFVDVTREAGVGGPAGWPAPPTADFLQHAAPLNFSTSAAFLDYDGDGWLDLFVCNYVTWSPGQDLRQPFQLLGLGRAYGPPAHFEGAHCFLYRNLGNGRFEDVSAKAGIQVTGRQGRPIGKALGVIVCDVDADGWPDIIVANDTVRNFFFHNKGDGTFEEIGRQTGIAYADSDARGAMGIDWGEFRAGQFGLVIGNFANEPNTLLRLDNPRRLWFSDVALVEGIAGPSRSLLKFGAFFFDYDLDGRLDLLTCNGHLEPDIATVQSGQSYRQPMQLFWNTGGRPCFEPVTAAEAGTDAFRPLVGRGCAFADINGDGLLDVVLTENGGPARLLRNEGGSGNHWLRLVLEGDGRHSNRSAIGARVTLAANGLVQHREVVSGRGYLSQSELPLTFGLGKAAGVDQVIIHWPGRNGGKTVLKDLAMDRVHHVRQAETRQSAPH
jgi:hypothetical protein